ncbi:hypothetical protein [Viridibacterium curvum]
MFSISENQNVNLAYEYRVLHFGASYKEIEFEWDEWLQKFERFLSTLLGVTAIVHMESDHFGNHAYEWVCQPPAEPLPPMAWEFQGGQRNFT